MAVGEELRVLCKCFFSTCSVSVVYARYGGMVTPYRSCILFIVAVCSYYIRLRTYIPLRTVGLIRPKNIFLLKMEKYGLNVLLL